MVKRRSARCSGQTVLKGVASGALGDALGAQERTASRQTATGIPTTQQRDGDGPDRWPGIGGGADADLIKST